MDVLVTGASGFVGGHLLRVLSEGDASVTAWGGHDAPAAGCLAVDLLDPAALRAHGLGHIEAVVHLAGLANVGASFDQPARYISENAGMEINLFETLLAQSVFPRVLVVSTGGVYAAGSDVPLDEDAQVAPANPYVISKLAQEMVGHYYAKRGFEVIVARPFNHVGPGQGPGFLVADLAEQIVAAERTGQGEVRVGDLRPSREYTDVRDVASAYWALLQHGVAGRTYNICSGRSYSGQAIAEQLIALSPAAVSLTADPDRTRPTDAMKVVASSRRLQADTDWVPRISLAQTLRDVLEAARGERPSASDLGALDREVVGDHPSD
jgi:GDP-4-dehydro-6-deoxy-D-mannose reductase